MKSEGHNDDNGRLLVVSNRLPVRLEEKGGEFRVHPSLGGLATSLNVIRQKRDMLWLGWSGVSLVEESQRSEVEAILSEDYGCIPLFIPQQAFERYYYGFSNGTIWPLFHYFPQYAHYELREWQAYKKVNELFRDKVIEVYQPGDRLWIHDYHLMLLPSMLRAIRPDMAIGFFLHIPFPSFETFRMLPWREEILRGFLGSDLIGFHSYSYARHFLSSLLRLLGLEQEFGQVICRGRAVRVDTFPLGIDVERFQSAIQDPEIEAQLADLRREVQGRKVILSVDRLDFTKGIVARLRAFERFLERYPTWQGKVTLIAVCAPSRTNVPEYRRLKRQVDEFVGRINGRFGKPGWVPIWYHYRSLSFDRLVPLYQLADVALVTPLRDGMNLVAKEYLASHPNGTGVLVLSETAGAAEELGEALLVNPHDVQAMVAALRQALEMTEQEQRASNQPMLSRLRRYNVVRWAEDFLQQLEFAYREQPKLQVKRLVDEQRDKLMRHFEASERRLLLLDYDGTLVPFVRRPELARPDEALIEIMKSLVDDRRNTVVVVSGRDHKTLGDWLGGFGLHLVAEHGAWIWPNSAETWIHKDESHSFEWMDRIRPILESFVDRTPGTILEEKSGILAWHYRRAEPEMALLRAKGLMDALEGFVANTPLQIIHGNKVIEVRDSNVNKGNAIGFWLRQGLEYDFVMAIGDDVTDEDMFEALDTGSWTIRVGLPSPSNATYSLPDPGAVRRLLRELAEEAIRARQG